MDTLNLLLSYRYAILAVLAVIEGPFTSLVAGFLIRLDYFSFLPVFLILLAGDLVSDTIYYFLAVKSHGERYVRRYGKKYKAISENFTLLKNLWKRHGWLTMTLGKFAYGFTAPIVISAALSKVSYKRLLAYIIPGTAIKYFFLIEIGYHLAGSYKTAEKYVYISSVFALAAVLALVSGRHLILRYLKGKAGRQ